jgi:heat shock protein HslJ
VVAGCTDDAGDDGGADDVAPSFVGTTWILDAASTEALIDEVVPPETRVTIRFEDDGTASGSAGCNSFAGSYTEGDDGGLTIEPGATTQMACEEPLMQVEAAYTAALAEVDAAAVIDEGAGLILTGPEPTLTYAAEVPVALEGTRWRIDGLAIGGDAVSSTIAGADADVTLDAGSFSGTTGCNRMTGGYETSGDASEGAISFGAVATTKMACEPDVAEQEATIIAAIEATTSYRIEGSTMTWSDADGSFLLSLTAS